MIFSIDRFEGDLAVCYSENGHIMIIDIIKLPRNAKETDCIFYSGNDGWQIDYEKTAKRKDEAFDLFQKLLNK